MASPGVQHSFSSESIVAFPSAHITEAPKSPCSCSHCCQYCEDQTLYRPLAAHVHCGGVQHSSSSGCGCHLSQAGCSRPRHCCPPSLNSHLPHQLCSCHGNTTTYPSRQICSCEHQRHQQSGFSNLPSFFTHYSVQNITRSQQTGITFAPSLISSRYGYAQGPSAVQPSESYQPFSEDLASDTRGSIRSIPEDSSHHHTHIHHHIHRHQHYPYSCVAVGHHHLPAMTVPSHLGASRLWRHMNSRGATSSAHPYIHFHPYISRVLPIPLGVRAPMTTFQVSSSEFDPEQADFEWPSHATRQPETRGLSKSEIEQLPAYVVTADSKEETGDRRCVICISDFEEKDHLRVLSCTHEFHSKCVDKWLKSNPTCPICRAVVQVGN